MDKRIRLFTPGPLNLSRETLNIGSKDLAYYRDTDFAEMTIENQKMLLKIIDCKNGRVIPYTSSGTGAMDGVMTNFISSSDKVLVINAGSFGQRWVDMCKFYGYNYKEIKVKFGKDLDYDKLESELKNTYNVVLMQAEETDSGQLFDVKRVGTLMKKYKGYLIVDAISSFLADKFNMKEYNVDAAIISSQKGLHLPVGIGFIIINSRIRLKLKVRHGPKSYYFDMSHYLDTHALTRGYVPFTPAVTVTYQLNQRLKEIINNPVRDISETKDKAFYFRTLIKDLPLELVAENPSNFISGLIITDKNRTAEELYFFLKEKGMYITKPGKAVGAKDPKRFIRICHSGLDRSDYLVLYDALREFFKNV